MEGEWFASVLNPRLAAVGSTLETMGTSGLHSDELRGLMSDIANQVNTAVASGTLTADEGVEAMHLLAEVVRAHGGVATERHTANVSTTIKTSVLGRSFDVPAEKFNPWRRRHIYAALVKDLNQSVADGKITPESAEQIAAQLRQNYRMK